MWRASRRGRGRAGRDLDDVVAGLHEQRGEGVPQRVRRHAVEPRLRTGSVERPGAPAPVAAIVPRATVAAGEHELVVAGFPRCEPPGEQVAPLLGGIGRRAGRGSAVALGYTGLSAARATVFKVSVEPSMRARL